MPESGLRWEAAWVPIVEGNLDAEVAQSITLEARQICNQRLFSEPLPYLEALVALRLLAQEDIEVPFEDAAHAWLFREWGWGAHLCGQTCHQLLLLLCLLLLRDAEPPFLTHRLLRRLMRIDDSFADLPRVPSTGALQGIAPTFRERLDAPEPQSPLLTWLQQNSARGLVPPRYLPPETLQTPCFGGAIAVTHRGPGGTLGTLSCFPLPSQAPAPHAYPVLYWQGPLEWGHLTWRARGVWDAPPETHALQRAGEALVLRRGHTGAALERIEDRWESVGQGSLSVRCLPLVAGVLATERLAVAEGELPPLFLTLWALSLEGEIVTEPTHWAVVRDDGQEVLYLDWELPGGLWQVRIDPLAKEPLCGR